jgi:hypothetical protein
LGFLGRVLQLQYAMKRKRNGEKTRGASGARDARLRGSGWVGKRIRVDIALEGCSLSTSFTALGPFAYVMRRASLCLTKWDETMPNISTIHAGFVAMGEEMTVSSITGLDHECLLYTDSSTVFIQL